MLKKHSSIDLTPLILSSTYDALTLVRNEAISILRKFLAHLTHVIRPPFYEALDFSTTTCCYYPFSHC